MKLQRRLWIMDLAQLISTPGTVIVPIPLSARWAVSKNWKLG